MNPKERLIVALDVEGEEKALELVEILKDDIALFKVGSELFTSCGPGIIGRIKQKGGGVFLDLKFHDIPNTVARSARAATRLGVFMFTVHSSGGYEMMREAARAAEAVSKSMKTTKPKIVAVTVLTSMDGSGLKKIGVNDTIEAHVLRLAAMAKEASLDGVVASPSEAGPIRKKLGESFLIITPGVRPSWAGVHDQKRVATPREAIRGGADYIVVGRPVIDSDDPAGAARKILEEIRG